MDELLSQLIRYAPNVFAAVTLACVFTAGALLVKKVMSADFVAGKLPPQVQHLLMRALQIVTLIIGGVTVLDQLGVNVTSMVAGLGIAGLALSLAAQDTVANMIAGVAILVDRPFQQGDWVEVDGIHATVTAIRLRTTLLTTFDNESVVLPNSTVAKSRVVNYTYTPRIRVQVPVRIAYKEDTAEARRVLKKAVTGDDRILEHPPPDVWVTELAESSVNLKLRFWVQNSLDKYPLTWEYMEKCKNALSEAGISIPFPHREVFIEDKQKVEPRES